MQKGKNLLKFICFVAIFTVIFIYVQEILRDKWLEGEYNPSTKIKGFYAEEENTLDVIFFGSSQMYADMAPAVLFQEYGIASYDFCANEQPLWITYYYIKEALKHQDPQVVVVDVFTVYGADYEAEGINHFSLDDMPMSWNKINAIRTAVPKDLRYSFYFPIAKYHNTWTELYQGKVETAFYDEKDPYKGYSPFLFAYDYEEGAKEEVTSQIDVVEIPERAKTWLYRIIELCEKEDVELVLIKTPNGHAERQKLYNSVTVIADETDTPFYNMNVLLDGQAHVNVIQAEKVSRLMGEYLVSHYDLEDRRNDPAYAKWYEDAKLFYRQKAKCEMLNADTFAEYVPLLRDENYVVCISAKNGTGNVYSQEDVALLNECLGTNFNAEAMSENGYGVILDGGVILQEGNNISLDVDRLHIDMKSPVSSTDLPSTIFINGTNFSMNCDGFNIVVYDKVLGETFEMSAFDLNSNMSLIRE